MAKQISDLSIFGEYKQPENRVTAALLHICKVGGEDLIRDIFQNVGIQIPESKISIITQPSNSLGDSTPDGLLKSSFSFNLYIESKIVKNSINPKQLTEHKKLMKPEQADFLVYITPDIVKPVLLEESKIPWLGWRALCDILNTYTDSASTNKYELLSYLVEEFEKLIANMGLTSVDWSLDNDRVMVVAGAWAEGIALKHGYYICQNGRSFKPSKYMAFYINSKINHIFEITEMPIDQCNLSEVEELKSYLTEDEKDYDGEMRKVFKIEKVSDIKVVNDKLDKNGRPCPYTQGQPRYTHFKILLHASRTSEL